ncbi:SDR family NAD(P)-dependent oxidoreductase [Marinobacter sp. SS21]|uniref:SDR family NAD(P)-dependent oxidoreductase n=1 Tax=Marinobacter sp. SS21 TaxID=2979460 RepID=UPI00232C8913|nr:SDR family NAD(P)-dependent oxidoreductase [Marinobacter sp. SS21]MDC0663474.1 SDR family NAD(P)-dependent oxidoreductase [Marinobacter sp. SS21]
MHVDVSGKTIVITGASSGIGETAARQLAAAGAKVCLVARREDELDRVREDIVRAGGMAWSYPADLTDEASLSAVSGRILVEQSRIDVLVNNAAHSIRRPISEALDRLHDYQRTININYLAAVGLTLKLLPRMLEQGEGQVVNISTLSSQVPIPLFSAYLASKAALESFSRSMLAELSDQGIAVSLVYFPMVRTPMSNRTSLYRHMPMMNVDKAAGWIVRAIQTRDARVGSPVGTLGSLALAALPGPVTRLTQPLFRQMDKRLAARLK